MKKFLEGLFGHFGWSAKWGTRFVVLGLIVVFGGTGLLMLYNAMNSGGGGGGTLSTGMGGDTTGGTQLIGDVAAASCPDDGDVTGNEQVRDGKAVTAGTALISGSTVYVENPAGVLYNSTTSSSKYVTFPMPCLDDKVLLYNLTALTQRGVAASAQVNGVGATSAPAPYVDLVSHNISDVQIRVKDLSADSAMYIFPDATGHNSSQWTNSTAYSRLNATNVYSGADGPADNLSVGQDGTVNLRFYLKSNNIRECVNEVGKPNWLTLDTGTDLEWDITTSLVSKNGNAISENLVGIDADSRLNDTMQVTDAAWDVGDICGAEVQIEFSIAAADGENPDNINDDLKFCLKPEGLYKSNKLPNTIKQGIYTDATNEQSVVWNDETYNSCWTVHVD